VSDGRTRTESERPMNPNRESRLKNRRGVALAFVALLLVVFMGMAALAVDLGMLYGARTEAQRVADAAALAGALEFAASGGDEDAARAEAISYGAKNVIRSDGAVVLDEDVDVEPDRWLVRVRVLRTAVRGSPMVNIFARALGFNTSDVSAVAAARLAPAWGTNCLLPFVIPDRWWMTSSGGTNDGPFPTQYDVFDPDNHSYAPIAVFDPQGETIETYNPYSSYDNDDRGVQIRLRDDSGGGGDWGPAMYFPIRFPDQDPGGAAYRERIRSCPDPSTIWYPGMYVDPEPGAMVGPTGQGFGDLENLAPNHSWNTIENCVWDGDAGTCINAWASPRTRLVAMFDPREFPDNPSDQFRITNFAGVFYEGTQAGEIMVRFVEYRGAEALPPELDDADYPAFLRILQLVE
jgi:Flp pilus assembly protein TadG